MGGRCDCTYGGVLEERVLEEMVLENGGRGSGKEEDMGRHWRFGSDILRVEHCRKLHIDLLDLPSLKAFTLTFISSLSVPPLHGPLRGEALRHTYPSVCKKSIHPLQQQKMCKKRGHTYLSPFSTASQVHFLGCAHTSGSSYLYW